MMRSFHGISLLYTLVTEPPSTRRLVPVINEADSDARRTTAAATSSGVPARPSSIGDRLWRKNSSSAYCTVILLALAWSANICSTTAELSLRVLCLHECLCPTFEK